MRAHRGVARTCPEDTFWLGFQHPGVAHPGSRHSARRCRANPGSSRRALAWGGRLRQLQSKTGAPLPLPSPLLGPTRNRLLHCCLNTGGKGPRLGEAPAGRTGAGGGGKKRKETCSPWRGSPGPRLEDMPGKAQKRGSWQHWLSFQEEGERGVAARSWSHRPGVKKSWEKGSLSGHAPSAHQSGCPQGTGERTHLKTALGGFPGGSVVRNLPANAGDTSSIPDLGRPHMPRSS